MTNAIRPIELTVDELARLWICWERGFPVQIKRQGQAEQWLRRGDYMQRTISPWAMLPEPGRVKLIELFKIKVIA